MRTPRAALAPLLLLACGDDPAPSTCELASDCAAGQVCRDGTCVDGSTCLTDAECASLDPRKVCGTDGRCALDEGFADECDASRPCPFGAFCTELLGRCLPSGSARDCVRRADCPSGQLCDRAANKCVPDPGCRGDAFCEPGEACDPAARVCRAAATECAPCGGECKATCSEPTRECLAPGAEAVCGAGERCDPLGRCVQCTRSSECGVGLYCNPGLGRCESDTWCVDDPSECPAVGELRCVTCVAPERCEPRTRRCQAPPTPCESDLECPGDAFCDLDQSPPICAPRIPDCVDDLAGEPNDEPARAHRLSGRGLTEGLRLCPAGEDWYRLTVPAGTYLTVDLRFTHAVGDLELQLLLADGQSLVDESRSIADVERVEVLAGTDLELLVRVFFAVPSTRAVDYALVVLADPGERCPDDGNEPDDARAEAKTLESDRPHDGRICAADPDWFRLPAIPAGAQLRVTLEHPRGLGDLDLELFRAGDDAPFRASRRPGAPEAIELSAPVAGDYFVRVFGAGADQNVYSLRADARPPAGPICADDAFEPNDELARARVLTASVASATLCGAEADWYLVQVGPGEALRFEVDASRDAAGAPVARPGDLDLALYEPSDDPRFVSPFRVARGAGPREHVAARSSGGPLGVRVYAAHPDEEGFHYSLRWEAVSTASCTPDRLDRAGLGELAAPLPLGRAPARLDGLSLCADDQDWFTLEVAEGTLGVLQLFHVEADRSLDLAVTTTAGVPIASTAGIGVDEKELFLRPTVTPPATAQVMLVRVRALNAGDAPSYSLVLDELPVPACVRDASEPNEGPSESRALAVTSTSPAALERWLCPTVTSSITKLPDEDWFSFVPPAGARITASLTHPEGDLFLELRSPGGQSRACFAFGGDRCYSDGFTGREVVTFTATVAAPYHLRVGSIYASPRVLVRPPVIDTPYRLELELSPP